jgi:hypothetical protein
MSEVNAWLLDLGGGLLAAVGELEMVHMLPDDPELFEIPQSPAYCRNVLVWQGEILPLMNLASRVLDRPVKENRNLVAITAFQEYPGAEVRHGALILHAPPERIRVNDSHACDLSGFQTVWRRLALACFEYTDRGPVPVLDLCNLFLLPSRYASSIGKGSFP